MHEPIENWGGKSEAELRAFLRSLDQGGLIAQELVQKGAMHMVEFLLANPGTKLDTVKEGLAWNGMLISEECARRGLPVIPHRG